MEESPLGTFRSTYQLTSFLLCITMMYPNPHTNKQRLIGFALENLLFAPMVLILMFNIMDCILTRDMFTLTHHSTVVGPYLGGVVKILISTIRADEGQTIIAEIERDYAIYNTLPAKYRVLARSWVDNSKAYAEKFWNKLVAIAAVLYLGLSVFINTKSLLFTENPKFHPIHDAYIPFTDPELRFKSPYCELLFFECIVGVVLVTVFYLGYESFFALALNHGCLKIEIFCEMLVDALQVQNKKERLRQMERVIKEQLRLFEYIKIIQIYFNVYLGIVLFATLIQIGTCLYHISESEEQNYQQLMITVVSIGAIYLPCYYAAKLKFVAGDCGTKFYSAGWHEVNCISTRKIVLFMICRAQIPELIMGFNFIIYDMQLFLSILQSAYSIYTLLCS